MRKMAYFEWFCLELVRKIQITLTTKHLPSFKTKSLYCLHMARTNHTKQFPLRSIEGRPISSKLKIGMLKFFSNIIILRQYVVFLGDIMGCHIIGWAFKYLLMPIDSNWYCCITVWFLWKANKLALFVCNVHCAIGVHWMCGSFI